MPHTPQQFQRLTFNIGGGVRYDTLDGEECIVVDTAMLEEGVWEGSNGPLYYPGEELSRDPAVWNHMPIVVYHPTDNAGTGISARDPLVLNTRGVGVILNTRHDSKLRTQAWMKTRRLREVDKRILDALLAGKQVEVSTGLFTENVGPEGEYKGKKYIAKATNYKPDHLAILPDRIGAYSVAAGGGMLQMNEGREPERTHLVMHRSVEQLLKQLGASVVKNEMSFSEVSRALADALASTYGRPGQYWDGYICEVYSDKVIYRGEDDNLYMVGYEATDTGVTLKGSAVQVVRVSEYRSAADGTPVVNGAGTPITEVTTMAFDKTAHIASLVGNGFEEKDREWLSKLSDDQLAKIQPKQAPAPPPVANNTPAAPPITPAAPPIAPQVYQEWRKTAPPEVLRVVDNAMMIETTRKNELVGIITTNGTVNGVCPFTKEFLMGKDVPELEALAKMVSANAQTAAGPMVNGVPMFTPNYMGAVGAAPTVNQGAPYVEEAMPVPELFPVKS